MPVLVLGAVFLSGAQQAYGQTPDEVVGIIHEAAARHGVSGAWLVEVARCETRGQPFHPQAVGDGGTSFGIFQLHRGGELGTFYARGFSDPFNVWEAAEFAAQRFAEGAARAWSCAR